MPLRPILHLAFAAAAGVAVLSTLAGPDGPVPDTAGVLALLTAALYAALYVRGPVPRWALAAGLAVLAVAWVVQRLPAGSATAGAGPGRGEYAATVLLLLATVALTVGTVALPQFRRPAWLTAAACLVALVPVAVVARDAAGRRDPLMPFADQVALLRHLAPGMVATALAGLLLVLAVSRADRWFLAPAGALLVQAAAARMTTSMSGAWFIFAPSRGVETTSAFLQPGLRIDVSAAAPAGLEIGAALALAALLLGPALIVAGAARTAGAPARSHRA